MEREINTKPKILSIIYTPFTGVGLKKGYRGDDWFKYRIEIFKKYTLKSLLNQSHRGFIHWLSFRPEEAKNPLVFDLIKYFEGLKDYPVVMSFNGLMYWDDKFGGGLKQTLMNVARVVRGWYREKSVCLGDLKEIFYHKNKTLKERLEKTFNEFLRNEGLKKVFQEADWIYLTRIDSDDMLHREAIRTIISQFPEKGKALVFQKGLAYNHLTGELTEWHPNTNPPFHTIIFPKDVFLDAQKYLDYMDGFKSHEDIPKIFDCYQLPDYYYCYVLHGKHISTTWNHPFRQRDKKVSLDKLKEFGL